MRNICLGGILVVSSVAVAAAQGSHQARPGPIRIVCMGDSITNGTRPGVSAEQTYEVQLQKRLTEAGWQVEVINEGIGGERTDQALLRFQKDALDSKPDFVTIMYGTNDCHWDPTATGPRLPIDKYGFNLRKMVRMARRAGAKPVLVTQPPITFALEKIVALNPVYHERGITFATQPYVHMVRKVAREMNVPLVDIFAAYGELALAGKNLDDYFTDGCHPNPAGHEIIAEWFDEVFEDILPKRP